MTSVKTISNNVKSITCLFVIILLFSCQRKKANTDYLGIVNLIVTGNESALPYFEKGLLLLHSFEYVDAREEFLKAQEADPEMSMAYWGEAMTYNHSLWGEQEYEKGGSTLERLKAFGDVQSLSSLEKDFIKATRILYQPDLDKISRDKAYAEYMQGLYEKYPDNHEIASFYALALLGSVPEGRNDYIYGQGAVIAQRILEDNPNHPGALHYLIHSYDDPDHAQLALTAANSYAKVAPDASHALHMPSHIYVALGMWDEVVASNEHSYQASLNRMERKKLDNDARGYHAYHWLEYGYLQQGRIEEARKMVLDMEQYAKEKSSQRGRTHLVYLTGTFLVETNEWDSPIADIPVDVSDLNVAVRTQYQFLEGMKAFEMGEKEKMDRIIADIKSDYEKESLLVVNNGITVCASLTRENATQTNIEESRAMEMQLRGLRAWMEDDSTLAEQWLVKSVELEESLSYSYGPPFIQKPTRELYADWLLDQKRPVEALTQYELTLDRAKNRMLTLKGKQKAATMIGDKSLAFAEDSFARSE